MFFFSWVGFGLERWLINSSLPLKRKKNQGRACPGCFEHFNSLRISVRLKQIKKQQSRGPTRSQMWGASCPHHQSPPTRALKDRTFCTQSISPFSFHCGGCQSERAHGVTQFSPGLMELMQFDVQAVQQLREVSLSSQVLQVFPGVTLWLSQMLCFSVLFTFNEVMAALKSSVVLWYILLSPLCLLKPHLHFVHPTLCLCACEIVAVQSREQVSILPSQPVSVKIWLFNDALIAEQKKFISTFASAQSTPRFYSSFVKWTAQLNPRCTDTGIHPLLH